MNDDAPNRRGDVTWTPKPDPTRLTTAAVQREIAALKELFAARLDANDKAINLLQANVDRLPKVEVVAESVRHQALLAEERFAGIEKQFQSNTLAIEAALTSQNKATEKSEVSVTKQLDNIAANMLVLGKSIDDKINQSGAVFHAKDAATCEKIDDVKNRLTLIEGRSTGIANGWGYLVGGVGVLIAVLTLLIGAASLYVRANP